MVYELHDYVIEKMYCETPEKYIAHKYQFTYKTVKIENESVNFKSNLCEYTTGKYIPCYKRFGNQIDKFEICDGIHENLKKIIKYLYIFETEKMFRCPFNFNSNLLFVTIDDKVFGFGKNEFGLIGLGHANQVKEVEIIPELCDKRVKEFFNGKDFVLCLTKDEKLFCWGRNENGQLGNGHPSDLKTSKPELIEYFNDKKIVQVCCNEYHSSVLTSDGNVYLWGEYYDEMIFDNPVQCEFIEEIKLIHCSFSNNLTICLTKSENVNYWKYNKEKHSINKKSIDTIQNVKTICSSDAYTYLISNDSIFISRGYFSSEEEVVIRKINFGGSLNAFSLTESNCVIYNNNCVYELYREEYFETKYKTPFDYYCDKQEVTQNTIELNVKEEDIINANQTTNYFMINFIDRENDFINILKPYSIANKIGILKSFIKYFHVFRDEIVTNSVTYNMLFVTNDYNTYGFGNNSKGNCGFGHNKNVSEPKIISELCNKNVIKFFGGKEYTMALTNDNELYAWGRISEEEELYFKPTKIIEFENIIDNICCSNSYALILMKDGSVYGWGDNSHKQIYGGNLKFKSIPLKFDKLPKIKLITCNEYYSVFVSEDNRIFILGENPNSDSSEDEDSKEICLNKCDYYIIKFEENLLNIDAGGYMHSLYLLSTNGELFECSFKKHNKKFNPEFEKLFSHVESIHSVDCYPEDGDFLLVVMENRVYYYNFFNGKFDTQYKTFYEYFAQELQITYKTIDLNFQNEIIRNDLQIKGCNNFEI